MLDFHLDRQAVGVPTKTPFDPESLHRPVARHDVLEGSGQQVAIMRRPGRKGRPVIEDVIAITAHRTSEDVEAFPPIEQLQLQGGKRRIGLWLVKHGENPGTLVSRQQASAPVANR